MDYFQYQKRVVDLIDTNAIKLLLSVAHHDTKVVIKSIQYIHSYLYYLVADIKYGRLYWHCKYDSLIAKESINELSSVTFNK